MRTVLENRSAGMKTNEQAWKVFYPNDTSMDRVAIIASTYFDFGKRPETGSQNEAENVTTQGPIIPNNQDN